MIRKNKKRIDPRYFLHELHEEDVAAGTTVAEAPPPPTQVTPPEETQERAGLENLHGEQLAGAELMLQVVQSALEAKHSLTKDDLERALSDARWSPTPKEDPTAEEEQI